jgi:drug/metabolite transporter (DMT)-like permease
VLFAFLVLLAIVLGTRREELRVRRSDLPLLALFGVVGLAGAQWSYYEAIQRLPIGVALVIQYTAPVLLLLHARWRGQRVGPRLWIAAALTLAGSYFAVGAYDEALRALNAAGAGFAVLSAFLFAAYFLLAERILTRHSVWTLIVYGFGSALLAWVVLRPLWTLPWSVAAANATLVAAVVLFASVIPFTLLLAAVRLIPAARASLAATLEPAVGALAAWAILGEGLEAPQLAGGAIVLVGIAIAQSLRPEVGSV